MNNFNNGRDIKVIGNFIINDNSEQYKPLSQCTIDELLINRKHREKLLKEERSLKDKRAFKISLLFFIFFSILAAYSFFHNAIEVAQIFLGIGAIAVPILIYSHSKDNMSEFEIRQIQALNEINHLLREKI